VFAKLRAKAQSEYRDLRQQAALAIAKDVDRPALPATQLSETKPTPEAAGVRA
jgi:hypothetical protein